MERLIVLDTETTGIDPKEGHRIIEVGAVHIDNREITNTEFHKYIQPNRTVGDSVKVHGITDKFLINKPQFSQISDDLLSFIEGSTLIIHNAPFDLGFLNHELKLNGVKTKIPPAGEGTPSKKLSFQDGFWFELILNLANLRATQITYTRHNNQPNFPNVFNFQKYIINAGATPKLIMSVNESSSFPTFEVPLINLAIRPSRPSNKAANRIATIANSNFPSSANLIEVKPIQTPIKVSMLGKITLAFFLSAIIFKLFFGCSISIFLLAEFHLKLFFDQL